MNVRKLSGAAVLAFPIALSLATAPVAYAADAGKSTDAPTTTLIPKAPSPMTLLLGNNGCSMSTIAKAHPESPALLLAFLAPIVVPLAQKAVSAAAGYGYDHVTSWLGDRKAEYTASTTATQSKPFFSEDKTPSFDCIELVRGNLTAPVFDRAIYTASVKEFSNTLPDNWRDIDNAETRFPESHLTSVPELYMAFGVEYVTALSGDSTQASNAALYMKVRPYELLYLKSGAKRNGDDGKQVVVRLTLAGIDGTTLSDQTFDLGTLKPGRLYNLEYLGATYVAVPTPKPLANGATSGAGAKQGTGTTAASGKETGIKNASRAKTQSTAQTGSTAATQPEAQSKNGLVDPMPITVTAIVTETEKGGDFARAVYTQLSDEATRKTVVDAAAKGAADLLSNELKKYGPPTPTTQAK
ncbi:hypothetical protein [Ralstonia sp.]|uniref:hypothetical protein n=1 Tax=Ralstonia sp. TaxID=54061 RepID=UPI0031D946B4